MPPRKDGRPRGGYLPGHFGEPAGWGDALIGVTAPFVAIATARRWRGWRAIATLWSPHSLRNPASIFEWGTGNVGVRAGGNLLREFWPDVKSVFHKTKK